MSSAPSHETRSRRLWKDLTSPEFDGLDKNRAVAVLPLAAVEQHGPHLPVSVDACINAGILDRAIGLLPEDRSVLVLPCLEIGASGEHLAFPGTLSLTPETAMRCWLEAAGSVARAGIRKLVLFNSHGGNGPAMKIVAQELRLRHDMLAVAASWFDFGVPEGLFDAAELRHGIHGGAIETSMMLHLRPDLVRMDRLASFPSRAAALEGEGRHLVRDGRIRFAWMAQDLNPQGACGDARAASAESGARLVEHAAQGLARLLEEVERMEPAALLDRGS